MMALRMPYVRTLGADAVTAALAADYLLWFIPAMALQFAMVAMGAALRGTGNFKPGMVVQTATVIMNMMLAPILIFGWVTGRPMGVAGARSPRSSRSRSARLARHLLLAPGLVSPFRSADWKPRPTLAEHAQDRSPRGRRVRADGGLPFGRLHVSRPFGAAAQAGFGIGMRIIQALFMPVVALGFAVAPVAGQNFGARKASACAASSVRRSSWPSA